MSNVTISYSESVQGFPSFYSFVPEFMIGCNNYFYTFDKGNLYKHSTNSNRNNFYGTSYPSKIKTVFNSEPLVTKLFKTITLHSNDSWEAEMTSDIQNYGKINASYFEQKEGAWFSYIRTEGPSGVEVIEDLKSRTVNGIGNTYNIAPSSINPELDIVEYDENLDLYNVNVGDIIIWQEPIINGSFRYLGTVYDKGQFTPQGKQIVKIQTDSESSRPSGNYPYFTASVKNSIAESNGILGHYGEITLTNTKSTAVELFAVVSNVMKSFP